MLQVKYDLFMSFCQLHVINLIPFHGCGCDQLLYINNSLVYQVEMLKILPVFLCIMHGYNELPYYLLTYNVSSSRLCVVQAPVFQMSEMWIQSGNYLLLEYAETIFSIVCVPNYWRR